MPIAARAAPLAVAAVLASCSHLGADRPARPPVSLPPEILDAYRPRGRGFRLEMTPDRDRAWYYDSYRFRFVAFSEGEGDFKVVEGRFYRTREPPRGGRAPLIAISPILAGAADDYLACRFLSWSACRHGFSTFWVHQDENILTADRDGYELELLLRENIRDNIQALDLLSLRADIDTDRLATIGVSLGAIKNVVLMAVEPRFSANVLYLAGSDIPRIIRTSREHRVLRYVERRQAREGLDREEIATDLGRHLRADPARFAPAIESERVLLFLGRIDDKVPFATGLALREELGGPETWLLPLGHYTSMIAAPWAADRVFAFLRDRFSRCPDPIPAIPRTSS